MTNDRAQSTEPTSKSPSTAVTTPDQSPGNDDDVWASDGAEFNLDSSNTRHEMLSDLPSIRRQHMTDGYREGLSIGKARVMQQGFDDGYPIGVRIALRAGKVLGVLDGYLACRSVSSNPDQRVVVQKLYDRAKQELAITALLKDMSDEIVAVATEQRIPDSICAVLERWERLVPGVSGTVIVSDA